jgi:methionyl-tRNA formyltransferase
LFQEKTEIGPDDNVEVLHDKLMEIGARLVIKTVDALAEGNVKMIPQEELIAKGYLPTPAPKIFKEDCLIDWTKTGAEIKNRVRGLSPYPSAWTNLFPEDEGVATTAKIFRVEKERGVSDPGQIFTDHKTFLKIGCADGWVSIKEIQMAGKKRMAVDEFLRGFQHIDRFSAIQLG